MTLINQYTVHTAAPRLGSRSSPTLQLDHPAARRVTLVATSPSRRGGTERVVYLLAAALRQQGVRAGILIPTSDEDAKIAEETQHTYEADGVPTRVDPRFSRQNTGLHNILSLRSLFRPESAGVINFHYSTTTGASLSDVLAARLAGKRCVLSLHHPVSLNETSPRKRKTIQAAIRLADAVVVTTPYTRDLLANDIGDSQRIKVIPLGVPPLPPAVTQVAEETRRSAARSQLGIPQDAFVIGHLARLVRYKGLFEVIQALARVEKSSDTKTQNPVYLVVAGDGPDRNEMQQLAQQTLGSRAIFLGDIPDPDPLYAAMDVFAMPSTMEGFGLVYLEAAQYGVPSIATPAGGVPYVVRDTETGLLVPQEPAAIAHAIEKLRAAPALLQSLGRRARDAAARFTVNKMADQYYNVLFGDGVNG